jgi:hypothetical protein
MVNDKYGGDNSRDSLNQVKQVSPPRVLKVIGLRLPGYRDTVSAVINQRYEDNHEFDDNQIGEFGHESRRFVESISALKGERIDVKMYEKKYSQWDYSGKGVELSPEKMIIGFFMHCCSVYKTSRQMNKNIASAAKPAKAGE